MCFRRSQACCELTEFIGQSDSGCVHYLHAHFLLLLQLIFINIIIILLLLLLLLLFYEKKKLHAVYKLQKDVCHNLWRAQTALIHYTRGPAE